MSETKKLKLFKHDNVETNTNKFDIEKSLNANWDKIDECAIDTDNQILQLQTEKAELETELKELQEDFYNSSLRGQASGEYIHVENSSGARCKIGIFGNSEQDGEPSPDNPVEVETVGGNVNWFDKNKVTNSYININTGIGGSSNDWRTSDFIEVQAKEYTFSWESTSAFFQVSVCFYDKDKNFLSGISLNKNYAYSNSFEVVENASYLRIAYSVTVNNMDAERKNIKLEKGLEATPYSPYGQGLVEVSVSNKNIMPISNLGTDWEYTENGIKNKRRNKGKLLTEFVVKKGQTVKFGFKLLSKPSRDTTFSFYRNDETFGCSYGAFNAYELNKIYEKELTATEDTTISMKLWGNENEDIFEFQLWAELKELTDYTQHEEENYIMPIQQEMLEDDYIDFENEEEVHTWGKIKLNGEEGISANTVYANTFNIISNISTLDGYKSYCNIASGVIYNTQLLNKRDNIMMSAEKKIIHKSTKFENLSQYQEYLKEQYNAGTPVIVYYKLAKTKRLPFTDEQKEIAKKIRKARTYKNVTNITTDDIATIKLDYAKDLETEQNKMQNEIDEIKQVLSTTQTSALLLDNMQKDIESEVE